MYEEKNVTYKYGINWLDLIIKIILVILFILLLVWLIPNPQIDTFYDSIFSKNIDTMRTAARNYYTVDRLPANIGDSKTMTLQEMIDSHMIIEFVDKDNKTCNGTDSYVQVTKTGENEYVLKVQLSCGEQTDYILETIGCYDLCPDGSCVEEEEEETKIEYQFKKEVTSVVSKYTCPNGYTKKGTMCYKNAGTTTINATATYFSDTTMVVDAKVNTTGSYKVYADPLTKAGDLQCPDGYKSNGTQCYKTYKASATTTSGKYTCPDGYTLAGTMCYKSYAATLTEANSLVCPDKDYKISGTTCYKTYPATYNPGGKSYTCPNGGELDGSNNCVYPATLVKGSTSYSCPNGGNVKDKKCVYAATYVNGSTTYSCPNGGDLSGTRCILYSTYNATPSTSYGNWYVAKTYSDTYTRATYSNDTEKLVYDGMTYKYTCDTISKCPVKAAHYNYTLYKRSATTTYSCPNGGDVKGTSCVIDKSYDAKKSTTNGYYSCPNGGDVSGSNCVYNAKVVTTPDKYTCPNGGDLKNNKCVYAPKVITGSGSYTCPNGGKINGTNCVISEEAKVNPNSSYTCPNGGTLNGSTCRLEKKATKGTGTTVLTCPFGGSIDGTNCITYADGTIPTVYYCPTGYDESGKGSSLKCYKTVNGKSTYYCEDSKATLKDKKCYSTVKGSISGYVCPTGYDKNGTKCTKTNTVSIKATEKKSETKSYKYTWSEKKTLEGWIATGKERVVK